jgi:2-amino-4-hydroxy-6-hydroxymethyldihydropteridine diphosphokinase
MIILLLGSNFENREEYLYEAADLIERRIGRIVLRSSVYETEPWGFTHSDFFLNQIVCLESSPEPKILMKNLMEIEMDMGRKRTAQKYASRLIDIDILFYNDRVVKSRGLEIPHPRLHLRKFALTPLNELFQNFIHPELGVSMKELLEACDDTLAVRKLTGKA